MIKRILCCLMCLSVFLFCGCNSSHKIDTAAIIENITVDERDGKTVYIFYVLKSGDEPRGIGVEADSFEEACSLAADKYIPNLSLAKLELLLINREISGRVLERDAAYIATQPSFSPNAYVALCDKKTVELLEKDNNYVPALIENQLVLFKNNNKDAGIDFLSIYNNLFSKNAERIKAAYISFDGELNVQSVEIP